MRTNQIDSDDYAAALRLLLALIPRLDSNTVTAFVEREPTFGGRKTGAEAMNQVIGLGPRGDHLGLDAVSSGNTRKQGRTTHEKV